MFFVDFEIDKDSARTYRESNVGCQTHTVEEEKLQKKLGKWLIDEENSNDGKLKFSSEFMSRKKQLRRWRKIKNFR